jgi:hypothetical protein
LQGLEERESPCDVFIKISKFDPSSSPSKLKGPNFWANSHEVCFYYEDSGYYLVRDGREILINPTRGVNPHSVMEHVLDTGLEILLHQRGYLVLHGSAIEKDGHAAIFLGDSGKGKSTTAAALCSTGCSLITDDLVAIRYENNRNVIYPGAPRIMLHDNIVESLGFSRDNCSPHNLNTDKKSLPFIHRSSEPAEVSHIFLLETGLINSIQSISHQEAIIELIHHTKTVYLLNMPDSAHYLEKYANLANNVSVKRLTRAQNIEGISSLVNIIKMEFEGDQAKLSLENKIPGD